MYNNPNYLTTHKQNVKEFPLVVFKICFFSEYGVNDVSLAFPFDFCRLWHELTIEVTSFLRDDFFKQNSGLVEVYCRWTVYSLLRICETINL